MPNPDQEARARRNYVSNMYTGLAWKEKVAHMPSDQVLAIYLRFIRDGQKPKSETPDKPDTKEEDNQFRLF